MTEFSTTKLSKMCYSVEIHLPPGHEPSLLREILSEYQTVYHSTSVSETVRAFEIHRTLSVEEIAIENTRCSRELAGSGFVLSKSRKQA
ncbi:hypothetical protein AN477_09665 [Alicyclobacillus ferrooxydans]|uniref:Uncharacterized protein n=1 Tax=Alicyclobacillus ferrooxydans TaxID=471514 RepID=A0A0P9CW14_9BACL|nr:hypothetical protein AN477_09665 [Alicyclobacillus ferrooxydans]